MKVNYFGGVNDYFGNAFFGPSGFDVKVLSHSATQVVVEQPQTGAITTINGTGFTFVSPTDLDPTGGTISDINFSQDGKVVATMLNMGWGLDAFDNALDAANTGNTGPIAALWNSSPNRFDASSATNGADMKGEVVPVF